MWSSGAIEMGKHLENIIRIWSLSEYMELERRLELQHMSITARACEEIKHTPVHGVSVVSTTISFGAVLTMTYLEHLKFSSKVAISMNWPVHAWHTNNTDTMYRSMYMPSRL